MTSPVSSCVFSLFSLIVFLGGVPCFGEERGHPSPFERDGGVPPSIQALTATDRGTLYAGSFGFGVFFSDDYGETWESINAGLKLVEVKSLLTHHGTIYAGTGKGVYQWDETEKKWSAVAPGLEQTLIASLAMTNTFQLFAGTAGKGLYQIDTTKHGTVRWEKAGGPLVDPKERLTHTYIRVTTVSPQQHVYVGTQDGGIYRSKDLGKTWQPIGRSLPNDSIRGIVATGTALYVATGRGVFKNNFQNSEWVSVNNGLTELSIQAFMASSEGEFYVGTNAGAFRSQDAGNHWVNISEELGIHYTMPRPYF